MADSDSSTSIAETVKDLQERVDTLEDRVMMERLEDLSLEDEIEVVEDFLGRQQDDIREKLEMLDRIEEEYAESQVEDKLQYLYQQLQEMQERQEELSEPDVSQDELGDMRERIDHLEAQLQETVSGDEDQNFDDVYDKLYTLRNRIKELQEAVEESGGELSESERETLVEEIASRIDTGPDISAEEMRDEILEMIGPEDLPQPSFEELEQRVEESVKDELGGEVTALQDELYRLASRVESEDEEVEELGETVTTLHEQLDLLASRVESEDEEFQEEIEELRGYVGALQQALREIKGRECPWCGEEKDNLLAHVNASGGPHPSESLTQEELEDELEDELEVLDVSLVEGTVPRTAPAGEEEPATEWEPQISTEELLEALEYEGEELEDRFKEILLRIEQLREEIGMQEERMDSLSHSQNIFESNIGSLMEDQKELNEKLRHEDTKLERKTDLLLEAIEKGLDMEERELRELLERRLEVEEEELQGMMERRLEAAAEEIEADEKELRKMLEKWLEEAQEEFEAAEEAGVRPVPSGEAGTPDEMVSENRRRIRELQKKIEDMEQQSPTIIE